jgi:hypothetical protein
MVFVGVLVSHFNVEGRSETNFNYSKNKRKLVALFGVLARISAEILEGEKSFWWITLRSRC